MGGTISWKRVEQWFGTTHFEDPLAELAKLMQIGTIADFQASFEKLLNRVTGVTETQLVSYVIGGLKSHIRHELLLAKPRTILAAFELAKAHEARHNELMLECRTAYNDKSRPLVIHEDIRWQPRGDRCTVRFLLLIGDEDDELVEGEPVVVEHYHTDEKVISCDVSVLNTMIGPSSPRSLRIVGNIKGS
nr:Transposon Ty3-G Gag-Pol polyprotein [Ipomoea batatas]